MCSDLRSFFGSSSCYVKSCDLVQQTSKLFVTQLSVSQIMNNRFLSTTIIIGNVDDDISTIRANKGKMCTKHLLLQIIQLFSSKNYY